MPPMRSARPASGGPNRRRELLDSPSTFDHAGWTPPARLEGPTAMNLPSVCIRRPVFTTMLVRAAGRAGPGLVSAARRRPLPQRRLAGRDRDDHPARGERRGDGDRGHQADRGGGQHHHRDRRAAIDDQGGGLAWSSCSSCSRRTATSPRRRSANKVSAILAQLPEGTDRRSIDKFDIDAAPVMTIAVSGRRDLREVTEIARKQIKEDSRRSPASARSVLVGGRTRAVNVVRRPRPAAASSTCRSRTSGAPWPRRTWSCPAAGSTRATASWSLRDARPDATPPREFNDLIVANRERLPGPHPRHRPRRGLDRGAADHSRGSTASNAVSLIVQKQSGTNTVEVVRRGQGAARDDRQDASRPTSGCRRSATSRASSTEHRGGEVPPAAGRRAWSRLTILLLHPRLADDADRHAGDPDVDHRHVRCSWTAWASRSTTSRCWPDPGHRHRHRRRGGGPREHLPAHGGARHGRRWRRRGSARAEIALAVLATSLSLVVIFVPVAFMGGRSAGSSTASA